MGGAVGGVLLHSTRRVDPARLLVDPLHRVRWGRGAWCHMGLPRLSQRSWWVGLLGEGSKWTRLRLPEATPKAELQKGGEQPMAVWWGRRCVC